MMTDTKLIELALEIDSILVEKTLKYEVSPLILGSVILARLMLQTEMTEENTAFRKLMQSALDYPTKPEPERTLQ